MVKTEPFQQQIRIWDHGLSGWKIREHRMSRRTHSEHRVKNHQGGRDRVT